MKITAVGDCSIQKNLPRYYDGFEKVKNYITRGDVRFFNLETTVCEGATRRDTAAGLGFGQSEAFFSIYGNTASTRRLRRIITVWIIR